MDDDHRLIQRTLAGDHEAFGHLVGRHADAVHAVILRACGDRDMAADLTQETFLKAFAALRGFDAGRPLRPWLLTVALNTARGALRAQRSRTRGLPLEDDAARRIGDTAPGPEELTREARRAQRLEAKVRQLPDKLRDAVALRFWGELSFAELAEALGVSESAAKMRVYRALEQLRLLVDDDEQERRKPWTTQPSSAWNWPCSRNWTRTACKTCNAIWPPIPRPWNACAP